jgi:DNA-binding transcriptional regulator of glucitol operon
VPGIIASVRERWLSKRSVALHAGLVVFVPGCCLAAWWQITRAADGNDLSFVYSVLWPIFAILGVYFWWMLIHTDYDEVGLKGMRRQAEVSVPEPLARELPATKPADVVGTEEDPELAAYNARLAALSSESPKTWRNRERTVVRRPVSQ